MSQKIIPPRTKKVAAWLLVVLIAIAAIINVPWALTRMLWRGDVVRVPVTVNEMPTSRQYWPSSTPHAVAWPVPDLWQESHLFGYKYFSVRTRPHNRNDGFSMQLQQLGWPWPVIEHKQMWWNWDDPQLAGPQPDPPPSLMTKGLVLNPIALGVGAWIVVVLPWLLLIGVRRAWRHRKGCCLDCAYPIGTSPVCTECGGSLA